MSYIVCIHRWVGAQALYKEYQWVCDAPEIHFVVSSEAAAGLSGLGAVSVADPFDERSVMQAVDTVVHTRGELPVGVVALNEADLLTAARLRMDLGLDGDDISVVSPFRDKLEMARVARTAPSVRTLATVDVSSLVGAFPDELELPMVVKPRFGTASRGVEIVRSRREFKLALENMSEPMIAQEACFGPTRHIDGWWDGADIVIGTASEYTVNCSEFGRGTALGSYELPPGRREARLLNAAHDILRAFSLGREVVFHLELFELDDELVFLEIASRAGGAEIPYLWRDIRGVDLVGIAWEMQAGGSTKYRDSARKRSANGRPKDDMRGGWVLSKDVGKMGDDIASMYWSSSIDDCNRQKASGVYEGAETKARFKSTQGEQLASDVRAFAASVSEMCVDDGGLA